MLAVDCLETDDLIESFTKTKIRDIFARQGEPAFRQFVAKIGVFLPEQIPAPAEFELLVEDMVLRFADMIGPESD